MGCMTMSMECSFIRRKRATVSDTPDNPSNYMAVSRIVFRGNDDIGTPRVGSEIHIISMQFVKIFYKLHRNHLPCPC